MDANGICLGCIYIADSTCEGCEQYDDEEQEEKELELVGCQEN